MNHPLAQSGMPPGAQPEKTLEESIPDCPPPAQSSSHSCTGSLKSNTSAYFPTTIQLASGTRIFRRTDGIIQVGAQDSTAVALPLTDMAASASVATILSRCKTPRSTSHIIDDLAEHLPISRAITLIDELLQTPFLLASTIESQSTRVSLPPPVSVVSHGDLSTLMHELFPFARHIRADSAAAAIHRAEAAATSTSRAHIIAHDVPSPDILAAYTAPYIYATVRDGQIVIGPACLPRGHRHSVDPAALTFAPNVPRDPGCPLCALLPTTANTRWSDLHQRLGEPPSIRYSTMRTLHGMFSEQWLALNHWLSHPRLPIPPHSWSTIYFRRQTPHIHPHRNSHPPGLSPPHTPLGTLGDDGQDLLAVELQLCRTNTTNGEQILGAMR